MNYFLVQSRSGRGVLSDTENRIHHVFDMTLVNGAASGEHQHNLGVSDGELLDVVSNLFLP